MNVEAGDGDVGVDIKVKENSPSTVYFRFFGLPCAQCLFRWHSRPSTGRSRTRRLGLGDLGPRKSQESCRLSIKHVQSFVIKSTVR